MRFEQSERLAALNLRCGKKLNVTEHGLKHPSYLTRTLGRSMAIDVSFQVIVAEIAHSVLVARMTSSDNSVALFSFFHGGIVTSIARLTQLLPLRSSGDSRH